MAGDRSALALERLDVSADDGGPPAAAPACDLADLAAALVHAEALISAGADESPDVSAAIERIADIAFTLHEREVEPSLCDALDAAMREISEANTRSRVSAQRAHEAAELLRTLARRLDAVMVAQAQPSRPVAYGGELESADEFPARARLFDAEVAHDGAFAQTVAVLAESLPERSDAPLAQSQDHGAGSGAAPDGWAHSDVPPEQAESSPSAWLQAENPASGAGEESAGRQSCAAIDPDEDPGDLFEPAPDMRLAADAAVPAAAVPAAAMSAHTPEDKALSVGLASPSPRSAAGASAYAGSEHAANDPLAPIRALSEEELIALFS